MNIKCIWIWNAGERHVKWAILRIAVSGAEGTEPSSPRESQRDNSSDLSILSPSELLLESPLADITGHWRAEEPVDIVHAGQHHREESIA